MSNRLDQMSDTLEMVRDFMVTQGMDGKGQSEQKPTRARKKGGKDERATVGFAPSNSDTTIYRNALDRVDQLNPNMGEPDSNMEIDQFLEDVPDQLIVDNEVSFKGKPKQRGSTSSEDRVNTSDEIMEVDCDHFIADCQASASQQRNRQNVRGMEDRRPGELSQGDKMIHDVELAKAAPLRNTGRNLNEEPMANLVGMHSTVVDEEYLVIGGHVDSALQQRIINFEYIDFARLLPKDRLGGSEDHHFELVVRRGATFFAPVSNREVTSISNFSRWEQAFRIYSNILTRAYPGKATELIQYNHTIYTATLSFTWENIYNYDKEFRMHVSKFPQRSWSIILQQAWSMCLKDRVKYNEETTSKGGRQRSKIHEPCRRFNKGKCTYGNNCIYDHGCSVEKCGKFGHGAHICCLKKQNSQGRSDSVEQDKRK